MLKKFVADESGQGMVEYGLILALIAVVVIFAVTALGSGVGNIFNTASNSLNTTTTNTAGA